MFPSEGLVRVSEILQYVDRDRYLDLKEAARYCGVSLRSLRRILPTGLKFRISERKIVVKKSEIDSWLEKFRQLPEQQEDLARIADEAVGAIFER